jgi:hypothetical protein
MITPGWILVAIICSAIAGLSLKALRDEFLGNETERSYLEEDRK